MQGAPTFALAAVKTRASVGKPSYLSAVARSAKVDGWQARSAPKFAPSHSIPPGPNQRVALLLTDVASDGDNESDGSCPAPVSLVSGQRLKVTSADR